MPKPTKGRQLNPLQRYRAHALELLRMKRFDLAEPVVRQVLSLDPDDATATRQLASCLLQMRRLDESLALAQRAIALAPDSHQAHCVLAAVHSTRYEHEKAIPPALESLRLKPDYVAAFAVLANVAQMRSRWQESLDWATKGLAIDPSHAALKQILAVSLARLGQASESQDTMEELLRDAPSSARSHISAGSTLLALKQPDEAADALLRALAINPTNPETHKLLGAVCLRQKRPEDARKHFEEALALHPGLPVAIRGLRRAQVMKHLLASQEFIQRRQFEQAERELKAVVEMDQKNVAARAALVGAIASQFRFQESLELAKSTLQLFADSAYAHHAMVAAFGTVEDYDTAFFHVAEILRLAPADAHSYAISASLHNEVERFPEALAAAEEGLRLNADHPYLQWSRAISLAGLGRADEAKPMAAELLSAQRPSLFLALADAGLVYRLLSGYAQAEAYFRQTLELDPLYPYAHQGLGRALAAQGRYSEARPHLEEALRLNPYLSKAKNALAEIEKIEKQK